MATLLLIAAQKVLNFVALFKSFFSALSSFFDWKHDEALREDGANEAELESRKKDDKIIADINADLADYGVREALREKYKRK